MRIGPLPDGTKGIDCNQPLTGQAARAFQDAGYRFAVRYVRRNAEHSYDLSVSEVLAILNAGLGLMVVQHVAADGWHPNGQLGTSYGAIAADETRKCGVPFGVMLWCDLEGVARDATAHDVIEYCNGWFDSVKDAGYDPGLYVGFSPGLTASQLYWKLKFRRYWSSYNLNKDQVPAVRGVCMRQGPYPRPADRVQGVHFEYDTDLIQYDNFNNLPTLLLPSEMQG
jgi:hypothetical protein